MTITSTPPTTAAAQALFARAKELKSQTIADRRKIHSNPELSFCEHETAKYVAERLEQMGCKVKRNVGGTGVVAEIGSGGKLVGLRADMDGLPIHETNAAEYCSQRTEVMHACGHDAHTACLLTAVQLVKERLEAEKRPGRVRFIFQPAEETVNADGKSGAGLMMDQGVIDGVQALVGLHVHPSMPTGIVAFREGVMLAACDSFDAVIKGRGSHGAEPHLGNDAIVLSSHAISALHQVVSRKIAPTELAVLTIGGIRSKTYAANIVSESVEITGTVRYHNQAMHALIKAEVERALSIVSALGGEVELTYRHDSPALNNDATTTKIVRTAAETVLGPDAVIEMPPHMGAEDFAFYTEHVPSCYFVLGVGIAGSPREIHTSTFDINEEALPIGAALLAESVFHLL